MASRLTRMIALDLGWNRSVFIPISSGRLFGESVNPEGISPGFLAQDSQDCPQTLFLLQTVNFRKKSSIIPAFSYQPAQDSKDPTEAHSNLGC